MPENITILSKFQSSFSCCALKNYSNRSLTKLSQKFHQKNFWKIVLRGTIKCKQHIIQQSFHSFEKRRKNQKKVKKKILCGQIIFLASAIFLSFQNHKSEKMREKMFCSHKQQLGNKKWETQKLNVKIILNISGFHIIFLFCNWFEQ